MKELIKFIKQKDYKYIKDLGQGGLGKTILIKDQEADKRRYKLFFLLTSQ